MTMKAVGIAQLKARLSEHLRFVRGGRTVLIADRGVPIAEIRPVEVRPGKLSIRRARRPLGAVKFPHTGKGERYETSEIVGDRRGRT